MTNVFLATIKRASLGILDFGSPQNEARWRDWAKENDHKQVRITLDKPVRSPNQNRLYWMYLELIERETGNDRNDLHKVFAREYLPIQRRVVLGKEEPFLTSTTELTKDEFTDYLDRICARVNIPIPDTEAYNKFYEGAPLIQEPT